MIEVIAMLIRWLPLAACSIMAQATTMLFVAYVMWNRTHFSDDDLAAKNHTPVSEEFH